MLRLDSFSEDILVECDRCKRVGEMEADLRVWEGAFYCWNCLAMVSGPSKPLLGKIEILSLN